ncbi:MAG: UpxY family transcription antiterminator [Syntrophaceae bacterium]|nr:UpxY family transcription antiterminator [Syntrophaceae bacterium]
MTLLSTAACKKNDPPGIIIMPWYAIHTKSRHERKANTGLTQKKITTFLPEAQVWSSRKDRKKKISVPLFPGYLFMETPNLDNETKLAVLKTSGVVRILGKKENSEPLAVPEDKIDAIRRFIQTDVQIFNLQSPQVGEAVRIIDGAFAGIEGVIISRNAQKELFVLNIEILHRAVAVKLEGFQIKKI